MVKAGIIGGAGYTGGEAIRLLLNHPDVELVFVHSNSNAGNLLSDVHRDLAGDTDMRFTDKVGTDVDVLFLCMGHGDSRKFLESEQLPGRVRIVDLSQDFRLEKDAVLGDRRFVYGLPELNLSRIEKADNIANPGCFATCLQLGILPLAAAGLLGGDLHVNAVTGSTGAGQKLAATSHFSWRENNFSIYKAFNHQHLNEICESVRALMPSFAGAINFIPCRGDFTRGIFATIYTECDIAEQSVVELYKEFYKEAPFAVVSDAEISLKQVVNTNKCMMHVEKHGNKVLVTSAIDNLLKGASGQAVENMNIMFGLDRQAGLKLKSVVY